MEEMTPCSSSDDRPVKRRKLEHDIPTRSKLTNALTKYTHLLATPDAPIIFSSYIMQSFSHEIQARHAMELQASHEKALICHSRYIEHHCGPNLKGATWKSFCDEWDQCRSSPPELIGKTKLIAQIFGEVMNGFVEPLGLKAMLTICIYISIWILYSFSQA